MVSKFDFRRFLSIFEGVINGFMLTLTEALEWKSVSFGIFSKVSLILPTV